MIKKCKQCGCILAPGESNKLCENCRKNKRSKQLKEKNVEDKGRGKKYS